MPSKFLLFFFCFNSAFEGAGCTVRLLPELAERAHPVSSWFLGRFVHLTWRNLSLTHSEPIPCPEENPLLVAPYSFPNLSSTFHYYKLRSPTQNFVGKKYSLGESIIFRLC